MIKIKVSGDFAAELRAASAKSKGAVMKKLVQELKEATPVDTGAARDAWRIEGNSIVNDVPYIDKLNSGSSEQAPNHFIEKTVLSVAGVLPNGTIVRSK